MPWPAMKFAPRSGLVALWALAGLSMSGPSAEATEGEPTLHCDTPATWSDSRVCGSPDLSDLQSRIDSFYTALQGTLTDAVLKKRLAEDLRRHYAARKSCRDEADDGAQARCLTSHLSEQSRRMDLQRRVYFGPDLPTPPLYTCSFAAGNQVEIRACLADQFADTEHTRASMEAAADAAMAELDNITTADVDAQAAQVSARSAFEAYRRTACDAVGTSYGGGSGTGIAILSCQLDLTWRRLMRLRNEFLHLPEHWADSLPFFDAAVLACVAANREYGDQSYVTDIWEQPDGIVRVRVADDTGHRRTCTLDAERVVTNMAPVEAEDVRPSEGLAVLYPIGPKQDADWRPPIAPTLCRSMQWFSTVTGSLIGWLVLNRCLAKPDAAKTRPAQPAKP